MTVLSGRVQAKAYGDRVRNGDWQALRELEAWVDALTTALGEIAKEKAPGATQKIARRVLAGCADTEEGSDGD